MEVALPYYSLRDVRRGHTALQPDDNLATPNFIFVIKIEQLLIFKALMNLSMSYKVIIVTIYKTFQLPLMVK